MIIDMTIHRDTSRMSESTFTKVLTLLQENIAAKKNIINALMMEIAEKTEMCEELTKDMNRLEQHCQNIIRCEDERCACIEQLLVKKPIVKRKYEEEYFELD